MKTFKEIAEEFIKESSFNGNGSDFSPAVDTTLRLFAQFLDVEAKTVKPPEPCKHGGVECACKNGVGCVVSQGKQCGCPCHSKPRPKIERLADFHETSPTWREKMTWDKINQLIDALNSLS